MNTNKKVNPPPLTQKYLHEPGLCLPGGKAGRVLCASYLRSQAEACINAEPNTKVAFKFGGTTYRCRATTEAIRALADKIEANRFKRASKVRPRAFTSTHKKVFNDFCQSGEIGNALTYAALVGLPVYFAKCTNRPEIILNAKEFTPGFVVGQVKEVTAPWVVTHLDTGLKAGSTLNNKTAKQAIAEFQRIPKEELERALERHKGSCGFQITGARFYRTRGTHND